MLFVQIVLCEDFLRTKLWTFWTKTSAFIWRIFLNDAAIIGLWIKAFNILHTRFPLFYQICLHQLSCTLIKLCFLIITENLFLNISIELFFDVSKVLDKHCWKFKYKLHSEFRFILYFYWTVSKTFSSLVRFKHYDVNTT